MQPSWRAGVFGLAWWLLVLVPIAACGGRQSVQPGRFDQVVLVTIDTLRADHLGCYGAARSATPTLDALAREGTLYEDASAPAPITLVSHATILSGLAPPNHGVRTNGTFRLPAPVLTLAERLKQRGFSTAAFVGSFVLHHEFGLDQGFDLYDDAMPRSGTVRKFDFEERRASEVLDRAGRWAIERKDSPFFLWAHLFDPHAPYDPPAPFDGRFSETPYDGEIAYVDSELGRFFARLKEAGVLDRALLIVTADHGEGLGEHGEKTHGLFLYQTTIRVPLIVTAHGGSVRPSRVSEPVGLVDVAPSILAAAGFTSAAGEPPMDGRVLPGFASAAGASRAAAIVSGSSAGGGSPAENGEASGPGREEPRGYYLENLMPHYSFGWARLRGYRAGTRKLIHAVRSELYDLTSDPAEGQDLASRDSELAERLLLRMNESARSSERMGVSAENPDFSAEAKEKLLALGYVTGPPARPAGTEDSGPDPREMLGFFERIEQAKDALREGRTAEGASILDRLASEPPPSVGVLGLLGQVRMERGEVDAAEKALKRALEIDPGDYEIRRRLAEAYYTKGEYEAAEAQAREALRINDRNAESLSILGASLARLGRHEEAIELFQRATAQRPAEPALFYNLGLTLEGASRPQQAESAYARSIELDPGSVPPRLALAQLLAARGDLGGARKYLEEAARFDPRNTAVLETLGIVLARAGDLPAALERFDQLVALAPDRPEGHYDRGLVLEKLGRRAEAARALEAFLARWKGDPARAEEARLRLRRLGS